MDREDIAIILAIIGGIIIAIPLLMLYTIRYNNAIEYNEEIKEIKDNFCQNNNFDNYKAMYLKEYCEKGDELYPVEIVCEKLECRGYFIK